MTITTIIPCYNAEPFLAEAIESVLQQTRPSEEVFVVDDCSTDNSRQIAERYPIRLLTTPQNSGHAAARNVGIRAATGDVIAWIDADDIWLENHLETVVGLLEQHPDADVSFSAVRCFGSRSAIWYDGVEGLDREQVFLKCLRGTIVPAMSAITRRKALVAVGGFDESYRTAPDYPLWLKMSKASGFVSTPEVTSNYRWHASQISANPAEQLRAVWHARYELLEQCRAEGNTTLEQLVIETIRDTADKQLAMACWRWHDRKSLKLLLEFLDALSGNPSKLECMLRRRVFLPLWPGRPWPFITRIAQQLLGIKSAVMPLL